MTTLDDMHAGRMREAAARQAAFNAEVAALHAKALRREKTRHRIFVAVVALACGVLVALLS